MPRRKVATPAKPSEIAVAFKVMQQAILREMEAFQRVVTGVQLTQVFTKMLVPTSEMKNENKFHIGQNNEIDPNRMLDAMRPQPGPLSKGERAVLIAIASRCRDENDMGITNETIAILTGYKETSRFTYLNNLINDGFVLKKLYEGHATRTKYRYTITSEGRRSLGEYKPAPYGDGLREWWMSRLGQGERTILTSLIKSDQLSKGEVEAATGYKETSVYMYLNSLCKRCLVQRIGGLYQAVAEIKTTTIVGRRGMRGLSSK